MMSTTFIQFDIKDFYPSITEEILEEAISFAKSLTDIDDHKIRTIKHWRKSLLFHNNVAWKKTTTTSCFDVTMGSYDGAEVCELVGIFILSKLGNIIGKKNTGLYRDDGLAVLRNMTARGTDKMRNIIIKMFKGVGCQLEIKSNLKKVEFLDVRFNLITGLYTPYKKPSDNLLHINTSSDHPPQIIKHLTNSITKRLCEHSANEQVFKTVKPIYENASHKSGYKSSFKHSEEIHQYNSKKRTRNIIWFNPPFSQTVKTNVAKSFFRLLDKHFPKSHSSCKIFNRNTIKVSYSCINIVSQIIKQHNKNVPNKKENQTNPRNCRNKNECPLNENSKVQNVTYKCTVSATQTFKQSVYLGIAQGNWK